MLIAATELKHALKKLAPIKSDTYQLGAGVSAQDSEAWVIEEAGFSFSPANVNGKKLTQVVNSMSGQIKIEQEERKLILESARAKIELEIQPVKPLVPPKTSDQFLKLRNEDFKPLLQIATSFVSSNKSADFGYKVQIHSLALGLEDETPPGYRIVGSDGNTLAMLTNTAMIPFEFKYLLNLTAASVVQLMDGPDLEIGETNSNVWVRSGSTTVFASKPHQVYPEYQRFIPPSFGLKLQFNPEDLSAALRTVEPLIEEEADNGAVAVLYSDGVVELRNVGIGETASDKCPCEQIDPDPVFDPKEIRFKISSKYLAQFLSKASGLVTLSYNTPITPLKFESGKFMAIISPMGKKQ